MCHGFRRFWRRWTTPIRPGDRWVLNPASRDPWEQPVVIATIWDHRPGWVRYYFGETKPSCSGGANDHRTRTVLFRVAYSPVEQEKEEGK
jgi:hypothetical protein